LPEEAAILLASGMLWLKSVAAADQCYNQGGCFSSSGVVQRSKSKAGNDKSLQKCRMMLRVTKDDDDAKQAKTE
jgi:hypothetical protein